MKRVVLYGLLLGVFGLVPFGTFEAVESVEQAVNVEKASVQYGRGGRPYSFYYPYRYQYYYPHPRYQASSKSCYWRYTNGSYIYYCQ